MLVRYLPRVGPGTFFGPFLGAVHFFFVTDFYGGDGAELLPLSPTFGRQETVKNKCVAIA